MTPYELFQAERYGYILPPGPGIAPADDHDRVLDVRQSTEHETEVNNLLNEQYE